MGCSPSLALLALAILAANSYFAEAHFDEHATGGGCYGSVGGANGHIYQFDGGHVSTFASGCRFLLARARRGSCKFDLYASFGSANLGYSRHHRLEPTRLVALTIKFGHKVFDLRTGRRLFVDGKPVNVLYSEPGVRAFFSGEDLVLVLKKCDVWITFDGAWTATFRLGSRYRGRVSGLAGNCDGNRHNDGFGSLGKAFKLWRRRHWVSGSRRLPRAHACHGEHETQEAKRACRKVIRGHGSCTNSDVLKPCMIDYCSTRYRPDVRKQVMCANFYLHSRRCARHHRPLAWRHRSGCPLKCDRHQHFSRKVGPCQKTCENHFFGTKRSCFNLPSAEGCRCNKGFVLDGSRCVRPKQCECLARLCIDRINTRKCRRWRSYGRCRRYPEVMGKFCRLTCAMCVPRCRNQISTPLCKQLKKQGKCRVDFYRMMCRATCQPHDCRCPPPRRVVSKCTHKYKNKAVTSLRWYPDLAGRCKKSVLIRFRACGSCRYLYKTTWKRCNYCSGVQRGKRLLQYRERYGKRRCIRRVRSVRRRCRCPPKGRPKRVSTVKCHRNNLLVRVTRTYKATRRCTRCVRVRSQKVIKKIRCSGVFFTGKCRRHVNHIIRKQFLRYARNCRCLTRQVNRRKIMCRCNKPVSRTRCKGDHFLTETTSWYLRDGRCFRGHSSRRRFVLCQVRARTWKTCQRKGCNAYSHTSFFRVHACKCRRQETNKHLGKCCCPPGFQHYERVNRYWKKLIIVTFVLVKYRCHKRITVHKIRIACPKGRAYERCDGGRGVRIFVKEWFVKRGNDCIKKHETQEVKIKCRRDVRRQEGRCHLLDGNVLFRRVVFHFSKRQPGSCECIGAKRTVKEMCGCRGGKYTRTTKCPRNCTARRCGNNCAFYKEFYYYKQHLQRCRVHVFKRLDFRCCCRPDRRVKVWCKDNNTSMQQISYSVLKSHKCHRVRVVSSTLIRCNRRTETKKERHPKKGFYYVVTYHWYVSKCKCRVRVTRKTCRSFCYKPTQTHFCDSVRREWITRHITWGLHECKRCVRHLYDKRVPVRCSPKIKRWKHCDKRTGILTNYKQWFEQQGCACKPRQSSKHLRCRCPKPVVGRRRCNASRNAFEKKITYWVLSNGRCHKRTRTERERVWCSRDTRRRSKCNHKKGVRVISIGIKRPKNCKCVRKWTVRNTRYRCNCRRENRRVRHVRRRFCDRRRNLKGIMRFYFVVRRGRCVRRTRRSYRRFRCPRPFRQTRRCNEAMRRQLVLRHYWVKRNCRCVKLVRRHYRRCGCRGRKLERRTFCRRVRGEILQIRIRRRWNHRHHYCLIRVETSSHRVHCRIKARYIPGRCIKNNYYVERKVFFVRKGCQCFRKEKKRRRNCHCKTFLRRYKCPRNGFTRREVTEIRRWDMKTRRCRTKRFVTRHIRCRCPKNSTRKYCKAGQWVKETVSFILRDARCYKKVVKRKQQVHCRHVVRRRFSACHGCSKFHYTLEQRLNPTRCTCFFAVVRKRRCPCCCPKNTNRRRCVRDDEWEHEFTNHAVHTGHKCGCRQWVDRKRERVHCSRKKNYRWLRCNRHTCLSPQQVTYRQANRCQCERRQRLTGKKRVCCCLMRPRTRQFCKNSRMFERLIFYQLIFWRCIQKTTERELYHWKCNRSPVTVIGRCNRATCQQSVHTLVDEVDRPHCRCHQVIHNRYSRPCCCLKRPTESTRCEYNCWVHHTRKYGFDNRRRVCVGHDTRRRWCVDCPSPQVLIGRCNRRTCRQRISHETHELIDCQCKRRVDFRHRICCCHPPTVSGPVCRNHRQQVWEHTSYVLSHGQCLRNIKETRRTVVCRRGETRVLRCNRQTCRQRIRHETLRAHHCHCRSHWRETQRTCCCRPAVRTRTRCERERFLVQYKTTRTLTRDYNCISRTTKHLLKEIRNCHTYERRGHCNKKTRLVSVHIFHQKPKGCECIVYRKSVRHVLCRCPGPRERTSKCNKKTCHLKVVKEWYTSHGTGDHFKCEKHHRTTTLRCCCHRRPTSRTFCDHRTGYIKKEDAWTTFQTHSRKCDRRHSERIVSKPVCPRGTCSIGRCNRSTGYKVQTCRHFTMERRHCKCKQDVTKHRIVCSCPKGHRKTFCKGDSKRITIRTLWRISFRMNRCVRRVTRFTRYLNCPTKTRKVKRCNGCRGVEYTHTYFIRRCRCVRKTRSRRVLCCCPKSHHSKRCMDKYWLIERVKYKLRSNRCVKTVNRKHLVVACRRRKTVRSKCRGCTRRRETLHFRVRGCKCRVSKRIVHKSRCCCPKPRSFVRCEGGAIKKVRESWIVHSGRCLRRRSQTITKVRCLHTTVKEFKCNRRTRRQKLVIFKLVRRGCRCVRRRRVRYVKCQCRKSKVHVEKCGRRSKRRVFRITFKLVHEDEEVVCKPKRRLLYWEPCRTPQPRRTRRCASNGKVLIITESTWKLVNNHGYHEIAQKVKLFHRLIECKGRRVIWSNCRHYRKVRSVIHYRPVGCRCRRRVFRQVFACNCARKSFKRKFCDQQSGEIVTIRKLFFSRRDAPKCSLITRKTRNPVHCSGVERRTRISVECGLLQDYGWYSKYLITWKVRRGCKCVHRHRIELELCRCRRDWQCSKCSLTGQYRVTVEHTHELEGDRCRLIRSVYHTPVLCESEPQVRFDGCNGNCLRQVSFTQCYVSSCRRRYYEKSALQLCCAPPPTQRRYCDSHDGRWVTELTTYRLENAGTLIRDRDGRVVVPRLEVVSDIIRNFVKVRCPRSQLREHCNRRTGKWRKTHTVWHRVGCGCQKRVQRWNGRCRCPSRQVRWSRCQRRYKVETVIYFELKNHKCVRREQRRAYLCACPKGHSFTRCDGRGHWRTCHISYHLQFRRQRCHKQERCQSRPHTCPVPTEMRQRCKRFHRIITRSVWRLDRRSCKCNRKVHRRRAECNCHKRRSEHTVCQHGAFITTFVHYIQRGERCVKSVREVGKPVYCDGRHRNRIVHNSCVKRLSSKRRGYQKLLTEWEENENCKCVRRYTVRWVPCLCHLIKKFRTRKSVKCVRGSVLLHTTIFFKLEHRRCVRKVDRREQRIHCKGRKEAHEKCRRNHEGDTYAVTRFFHKVSNGRCGCVWKQRSLRYRICKCRKLHHSKICIRDRVWHTEDFSYDHLPNVRTCRRHIKRNDHQVHCPRSFTKKTRCNRCRFTVRHYAYMHHGCRCVAKLQGVQNLRCCCAKPVTKHSCDARKHLKVAVTVTYILRNHACHRKQSVKTQRVRCNRIRPHYRESACRNGFRKIFKTIHIAIACSCRPKTTVHKQRCACSHERIYKKGKCGRWFALDMWLAFKLMPTGRNIPGTNKPEMKCVRYVAHRQKRRCRCPKGYQKRQCKHDNIKVHVKVSYRLRHNSCQRIRTVREQRLPCSRRQRLVRIEYLPRKCSRRNGYVQVLRYVFVSAKRCRCVHTTRQRRRICDCFRKYGQQTRRQCVKHNRVVTTVTWRIPKGDGCEKRTKRSVRVIHCSGERVKRGECGHSGRRTYRIYTRHARNCACVWKLVRRVVVPCRCRKAVVTKRCTGSHWETLTKTWHLVGRRFKTHCKLSRSVRRRRVPCDVGTHVRRSHCDFRGLRHFVTTTKKLRNCQCIEKEKRHSCRCRCDKPETRRYCQHGRVWVTVTVTSMLKNCACIGKSSLSRRRVRCPRSRRVRGPCRRGEDGDRYRKITRTRWVLRGCKCRRVRSVRRILCGCDRRRRVHHWCLAGYFRVVSTTVRRLIEGRCRRECIGRRRRRVRCGRVRVRRVCNRESGRLTIFVTRPYIKRCRCYRRVQRHRRRCGCHKGSKLVSVGRCNRETCRQRLLYKKQVLRYERCRWRKYHRHRVCCCRGRRRQVRCQRQRGLVVTTITKRVLRNWHCVRKVVRRTRRVKCKRNLRVRKRKLPHGFLKVTTCWKVRRGCDCVKRCKTTFERYRCWKPKQRTICKCSSRRCRKVKIITTWRLSHGRCLRQTHRSRQPIVCSPDTVSRTRCNKRTEHGFYYVETIVTWHQKNCRCRREVRTRSVVCRCLKPHSYTTCHHGRINRVNISYRLSNGRCVKVLKRRSRTVYCDRTWRLSHRTSGSPVFYKVYERFILVGCRCERQTKRVPCRSRCSECTIKKVCEDGRNKVQIRTCWRLEGCRCVRNVTTTSRRVRCPKTSRSRRCRGCELTVVTREHNIKRCKCILKTKTARSKCCCPRQKVTKACVRGSIRIRRVSYKLRNGHCISYTKDEFKPVHCSRRVERAIRDKCKRGKQRYSVHFWVKLGCRCVRKVRYESRRCACANKAIDLYLLLDVNSCRRNYEKNIVNFVRKTVDLFKDRQIRVRTMLVSHGRLKTLSHANQISFRSIKTSKTNLLNGLRVLFAHLSKHNMFDIHKSIVVFTCGKHSVKQHSIEVAERIQRLKDVTISVCAFHPPLKVRQFLKLISSRPHKEYYMELDTHKNYLVSATSLFERICKRSCAKPVVSRSKCHRSNCRRVFKRTTFHFDQHKRKCVRRTNNWWELCCCLERNRSHKECIRNRLFEIEITHNFHDKACHRKVHKRDVSGPIFASCRPHVLHRKGECHRNGWRKDTKETRQVINCRCHVRTEHYLIRCRCPRPHEFSTCQRNNRIQHCHITYSLTPTACILNRSCRSRRVTCQQSRIVRGKCDRFSCLRDMGSVWYTVQNCQCRRHFKNWKEICCCKRQYQKVPHCDKQRHERVEIESWLEFYGNGCRRVYRKLARPVHCPSRRVEHTQCVAMRDGYYRKRLEHDWQKSDCGCKEDTQSFLELCRCRRGRTTRKCRSGSWVVTKHWLQKLGNRCVPRTRIVSRIRVTCNSRPRTRIGLCRHKKGDYRYAQVVQTWKRRVGCACKTARRVFFKLCGCPKPFHRTSCRGNSRRVTTRYTYKLRGDHCKLYRTSSTSVVHCRKAHTRVSKCQGKTQAVIVTLYRAKHCRCSSKVYRRLVRCKAKCRDFLPTKICRKWASGRIRLCDKHPHFAKRLCALTCHRCYDCQKTRIVYAGKFCLSKQRRFTHSFFLERHLSFRNCVHSCQHNPKCRAFDYEDATRKCRLLRVHRDGFLLRFPGLRLRKTPGCILFERICPKKCSFRRILRGHRCRCIGFGENHLCYRTTEVATWRRDRSGRCKKRVQELRVPCRRCEDKVGWCKKSKCSNRLARSLCRNTCRVCKRKPMRYHRRGRCSRHGWLRETSAQVYFDKKLHIWRVRIVASRRRCARCPVGSYQLVGRCKGGRRKVTRVVARYTRGRCRVSAHTKVLSCRGCNLNKSKLVGNCKRRGHRWIRLVVTQYTVRVAGRCVVRSSTAVFSCSPKCPRTQVSHSKCKCGKRIRCVHYTVTYPGFKVCIPKKYTTIERCVSAVKSCRDIFRPIDCLFVKKNRMCRSMRSWCRKTCGQCE